MATFGRRVQPKHRAEPAARNRDGAPGPGAPRPGAHAAPVAPEEAPTGSSPEPVPPAPQGVAPTAAATQPEVASSPERAAAPVSVASSEAASAVDPDTLRVLVVDDNEDVRGLLRIAFARADIDVVGAASDSREALALTQHDQPDLVLLDVNLPEMPGLDILPLLRERSPRARVVMFSAQCSPPVTEMAMERGAMGFVEKGVSMKNLVAHLREVARAPEGQAVQPFPLRVYQ
jgi:CheY-like chemotaxis protein